MKPLRETFLAKLDGTVRWTGMNARVADEMSDAPSADRKHRPLRWIPILPIALSCAVFVLFFISPPELDVVRLGAVFVGLQVSLLAMLPAIHLGGPLGKPSLEDDEREAALRKDSFLFCLGLLAALNCVGQPILMILSHGQHWQTGYSVGVASSALMLNISLFGCLPTLYASWNLRQLPRE
ncbi:hypothetical protein DSM104443_01415 [Usitatibacter rugosus]|uniref:Uncharacterized protein n=1 Tax=Usitatibacter rugosus TaxID=2732067 RepID=A0A6M4GXY3_9PROT|nr:hypothetical protein [Usitatibacter rugosus]QJR10357.1 hypothetical protein DSM104443_01415 [Usitatibacter rugosus]